MATRVLQLALADRDMQAHWQLLPVAAQRIIANQAITILTVHAHHFWYTSPDNLWRNNLPSHHKTVILRTQCLLLDLIAFFPG